MYLELILIYITIFIFGITIGSFLNVCIYRIPEKKTVVTDRSHCMKCGYQLAWYDMFPVLSWLALGGKCRKCKEPISAQYPIIEALNGIFYTIIFMANGLNIHSVIYCLLTSALIVLSVIDWRTYEIPICIINFILVLGILQKIIDHKNWINHVIGFLSVSILLWIIYQVSNGSAIGGGDVMLMAVAGLVIGWKNIILAFLLGCIAGSVIHIIRMKVSGANRVLAMGPYLSVGIFIAAIWGNRMISWYLSTLGL